MSKATKFSFSALATALALGYALPSYAEIESANGNTQISRQNQVEIVNIATPSASGLSHNQYNKYNVDRQGAVLNNARQAGTSELAGHLSANPNLKTASATVILNEVVSRNPSTLSGKQEVFGQRADYILANPNGISCDGCGFINTPKASLIVGKPNVNDGKLTSVAVTGDKALTASGEMTQKNVDELNLVAPTVNISGNLKGSQKVNVVMGQNTLHNVNGEWKVEVQKAEGQVLDGQIAGSMQAGSIRIHSTDPRAKVNVMATNIKAQDVTVDAGNLSVYGKMTGSLAFDEDQQNVKGVNQRSRSRTLQQGYEKSTIDADKVTLNVQNNAEILGADLKAKEANLVAGKVHLGSQKTVVKSTQQVHQSKGQWYRNETETLENETAHRTTLTADNMSILARDSLTSEGAKISAKELVLSGDVALGAAKTQSETTAEADFRNETARLKTGESNQRAVVQGLVATEIYAQNALINSERDVVLRGVKGEIEGNLAINNNGHLTFTTESTENSHSINDKEKFWGGLAGSKTLGTGRNETIQHGTDLTVKGVAVIDAKQGVQVTGSRVLAGSGLVKGNQGALVIDTAQAHSQSYENSRQGTIFDITKARKSEFKSVSTAQGSTLKSESNLELVSDKQIAIKGSQLESKGLLNLSAPTVNVVAAENHSSSRSEQAGFNLSAKADKPTASFNHKAAIKGVINNLIKGEQINLVNAVKDNIKAEAKAQVALGYYNKNEQSETLSHSASQLSGGNTAISGNQINVQGSKIASNGDLSLNAKQINTSATLDSHTQNGRETKVGVTLDGKVTESSASSSLKVGVTHKQNHSETTTAQGSQLSASKDLTLNANQITHQGSSLSADNNLVQNAASIKQINAESSKQSDGKNVDVSLTTTASINKAKAISAGVTLAASGGNEHSFSTSTHSTSLQAGNNIVSSSKRLDDVGTQYQAGNDVNLTSEQHNVHSAQAISQANSHKGGASIGVSGSTTDLKSVNLKVNASANYEQNQTASTTASKAQIQGKNVNINTGKLNSQADINASQNLNINASQGANFSQSQNTASEQGGGFNAKVGVGGLVLPTAGVVIPSVDVSVSANGKNQQNSTAVSASLNGKNVAINSQGNVNVQGTNINGDNVALSGKQVNVSGTNNQHNSVSVGVDAGVALGKGKSSVGVNAGLDVKHEKGQSHDAVNVAGKNLNIQAGNGVTLSGVNAKAENANINSGKGDLNLNAQANSLNRTNVGVSVDLNGGVAEKKWNAEGGSASLSVDVARNHTHTSTVVNSTNTNLNVGGSANLNGSQLNADNLSGKVQGDVTSTSLVNKVNETSVSLSASGSGKPTPYPSDKWLSAAKNDWDNGTIAGVAGSASLKVDSKKEQSGTPVNANAKENSLAVGGKVTQAQAVPTKQTHIKANVGGSTSVKEQVNKIRSLLKRR